MPESQTRKEKSETDSIYSCSKYLNPKGQNVNEEKLMPPHTTKSAVASDGARIAVGTIGATRVVGGGEPTATAQHTNSQATV